MISVFLSSALLGALVGIFELMFDRIFGRKRDGCIYIKDCILVFTSVFLIRVMEML